MIPTPTFKITPRPPWRVHCLSRIGEGTHDHLIEAWWTHGYTLLDDRLVTVEVDRAPNAHTPGVWAWVLTPAEHEGDA